MNIRKEVYKTENGYGYKIYREEKLFIVQEYAPAISGNVAMTKGTAERLSDLVVKKLEEKPDELPTLTITEVEGG